MNDPKVLIPILDGNGYIIPTYIVEDNKIVDGGGCTLKFCKGSIADETIFRQEGVFSESLLQAVLEYLNGVNKGELSSRHTSIAITKIEEALMWLEKRKIDRQSRNVLGTYNK